MMWAKQGFTQYFICIATAMALSFLMGCGGGDEGGGKSNTGTYQAKLAFPADTPRLESGPDESASIDCETARIGAIDFSFTINGIPFKSYHFACHEHGAQICDIPAGVDILVEAFVYDLEETLILRGSTLAAIEAGKVNEGQEIILNYLPVTEPETPNSFTNSLGMHFVRIPAGTFPMGSPPYELGREDDELQHQVRLTQPFYMQDTEVTQGEWKAVMGAEKTPYRFGECGDNCPVESVSWAMAQTFIMNLNQRENGTYRLPTEAEWEYAARAGSTTVFGNGDITLTSCNLDPVLNSMGWYCGNSRVVYPDCVDMEANWDWAILDCAGTNPVRQKSPNAFGLYDMHGNVGNWVQDWYSEYPTQAVIDPTGPSSGSWKVYRGGGWSTGTQYCRSANRAYRVPNDQFWATGFRLVCTEPGN